MSTSGDAAAVGPIEPRREVSPDAPPAGGRATANTTEVDVPPAARGRKRLALVVIAAVVLVGVAIYLIHAHKFEDTDDAQVDGNISNVGARVAGTVTAVRVVENQAVHAGDVLLEIDATDLKVAQAQAKASVAQAEAQLQAEDPSISITETSNTAAESGAASEVAGANAGVTVAQREVDELEARRVEAEGNARLAELERRRGEDLLKGQAIPRADMDRRTTTAETAVAQVQAIQQSLAAARQRVIQQQAQIAATRSRLTEVRKNAPKQIETRRASVLSRQANLELARAQLAQAELNLGYVQLRSPVTGVVAKKGVSVGEHVAPGQLLMAIAQTDDLWVTANFRETQLERVQIGQAVALHVDALDADLTGKVESLGAATGSRLSLLPPENASGNYVKVVQRIPVRIRLDPGQPGLDRLRPGMSVEPKIRVLP